MIVLTMRTDKPEAEIGLYDNGRQLVYETWEAHRQLAETLHNKLKNLLDGQHLGLKDTKGIIIFEGPGSFTGLRIGISVANALAYSQSIPILGSQGDDWIKTGLELIERSKTGTYVSPFYGAEANITVSKK